jgi:hypothetical protein
MSKIVTNQLRPEGRDDPEGVAEARRLLDTAYGVWPSLPLQTSPTPSAARVPDASTGVLNSLNVCRSGITYKGV